MADAKPSGRPGAAPLVTVMVNNYNYGRFLRDAIDSALAQTYANTEVVVVDDGSTDDSRDIIRSYGARIRAVLKSNGGQGSAVNAGFAAARGSLIALLDSDDVFLPDKVRRCVEAAAEHPSAQLVYHRVRTTDAGGVVIGKPYPRRLLQGSIAYRVQRGGGSWQYAPTSGQVFRREFLARVLPVPEAQYRTSADAYVACLAGMLTDVAGVGDVLTHYRVHGANAWMSGGGSEGERLAHHIRRFEIESAALNEALARLGSPRRVTLRDNFMYQFCRYRAGRERSLGRLAWLTVRDPSDGWIRGKTIASNLRALLRRRPPAAGTLDGGGT